VLLVLRKIVLLATDLEYPLLTRGIGLREQSSLLEGERSW
jgi:hypothetical protein